MYENEPQIGLENNAIFNIQKCTIEIFVNGKMTLTGAQTKCDLQNILEIVKTVLPCIYD